MVVVVFNFRGNVLSIWISEWYHDQLYSNNNASVRLSAHTTYHPQLVFHSSCGDTFYAYGSAYAQFDFSDESLHRFHFASMPYRLELSLVGPSLDSRLYPLLPEWIHNGIILNIQCGTDVKINQ